MKKMYFNLASLADALMKLEDSLPEDIRTTKIVPAVDGIVFEEVDGTHYKYFYDGRVAIYAKNAWHERAREVK